MKPSSFDIIPADWMRWSLSRPTVVKQLAGGLTNTSFLIAAGDELLVLRKNSAISDALDLNRAAEAEALGLADNAGLCARLIHCDPDHRYLVTRYIEGALWDSKDTDALQQLAGLLSRIHSLPAIDAQLDVNHKVASYWQSIDENQSFYQGLKALDRKMHRHIAAVNSLSDGSCLCHNDLLATNLIVEGGGRLYAIDWEYAAMGDRFYDLAVIVGEYGLDEQQQELLLAEYLGRPVTSRDWERLDHWRVIYGYLSVLWYGVQWSRGAMTEPNIKDEILNKAAEISKRCAAIDR